MKFKIFFIIVLALLLGGLVFHQGITVKPSGAHGKKAIWYCPMHPWIKSGKPGVCPICGMALVSWHSHTEKAASEIPGYVPVEISQEKQQLAAIRTALVQKKTLTKTIRAAGYISTNHELYMLQDEYIKNYIKFITVYRDAKRFEHTRRNWESHRELQLKLHEIHDKLLRLGLGHMQIQQLEKFSWKTPWDQPDLLFLTDTFHYWAVAQIFEDDIKFIKPGQQAEVDIPDYGMKFKGIVRSIGGIIDEQTRTVSALVELKGDTDQLKGNMFVNIQLPVGLKQAVVVPSEAIMDTGLRKVVFIEKSEDKFEPRNIETGLQTDNGFEVKSGLKEGERIVVSGNFLLDSEARVQADLQEGGNSAS